MSGEELISSRAVTHLCRLLTQNPSQFEITILPVVSLSEDDGGVGSSSDQLSVEDSIMLVEETYLGLDARSLPWMTREIREEYRKQKYKGEHSEIFLSTLSCLLLVNPDHATAWADRRRCLLQISGENESHLRWRQELQYINLLMTQHSKAPFSWAHRKYVLQRIFESNQASSLLDIFMDEAKLCREVAERYPKNYYAWTHRRYLLGIVMRSPEVSVDAKICLLQQEWDEMIQQWLPHHTSDHSAAHFSSEVLSFWMTLVRTQISISDLRQLATDALEQVTKLVEDEEPHETLWILRRTIVAIIAKEGSSTADLVTQHIQSVKSANFQSGMLLDIKVNLNALSFLLWMSKDENFEAQTLPTNVLQEIVSFLATKVHHCLWATGEKSYGNIECTC